MSELLEDFWRDFSATQVDTGRLEIGPFRFVHGQMRYVEFEGNLGAGFRARAIALFRDDEIQAQLLSSSAAGKNCIRAELERGVSEWMTANGLQASIYLTPRDSHARINLVWPRPYLAARKYWPAHHLWLSIALNDLVSSFAAKLSSLDAEGA